MMRAFSIGALVVAAVVRAACVSDPAGTIDECRAFSTLLTAKDRMSQSEKLFNPNEPITFELLISNTLNVPATLTAGSSCTAVVFEVTDSQQERLWGSADDIACIQMLQPRKFDALEAVAEAVTWDQKSSGGTPVPPGTYTVTAVVGQFVSDTNGFVDCRGPLGKSSTFTIR